MFSSRSRKSIDSHRQQGVIPREYSQRNSPGGGLRTTADPLCAHTDDRDDRIIGRKYYYFDVKLLDVVGGVVSLGFVG